MSLRSYLFLLIGCLISFLTMSQLAMLFWIESNIAKEVDFQARHYSEQIIELAVDQLNQTVEPTVMITTNDDGKITQKVIQQSETLQEFITNKKDDKNSTNGINQEHNQSINENIEIISFDDDKVLKKLKIALKQSAKNNQIRSEDSEEKRENNQLIHQKVKSLVDNLHSEKAKIMAQGNYTFVVDGNLSPSQVTSNVWQTRHNSPRTVELFQTIQVTLIVIGLLGIIFAYWLSIQFNKPLKQLSKGFKRLAGGNYQHQVAEQGVKEIRETMQHYNQMVKRLHNLSMAEKQHKEIAHLAELGEVSRGLAHALRNPIHTIGLSIEQLSDQTLSPQHRQKLLHTIQQKITNIDKNIKGLLTLTTAGISRTDRIPVAAVVQDIMLEYKACDKKSIQFELNIDSSLSITGAESEVRSILHTLINNACEANDKGNIVCISASHEGPTIIITIRDHGTGLDKHIEPQLFQPHVSSKPEGAGMGLYIAQRLVSLHYRGLITLENTQKADIDNQVAKQEQLGCTATVIFNQAPTGNNNDA